MWCRIIISISLCYIPSFNCKLDSRVENNNRVVKNDAVIYSDKKKMKDLDD